MHRVIVLDNIAAEGLQLLEDSEGVEYEVRTGLAGDELREVLSQFDAAICRSGVKITADALEGNQRLKAIARAGVGTDNIDKVSATKQGIIVMNTPSGNTTSTAEHAFALMLGLARNLAPAHQSLREGRWDRKAYMGSQLEGKTLGIVGMGRIGQEVARRARVFGMRVMGFDPFMSEDRARELGIEPVANVADMLPEIDFLTVHTPLTPETENLIGEAEIELMKPGTRLINCARGGIYNEQALVAGLKSGKLGGVAMDVYAQEPCTDHDLFAETNALCTPHLGASTEEAQTLVAIEAVKLVLGFLTTGEIRHAVNASALDQQTVAALRGELNLAHRLGRFLSQWYATQPKRCVLTFRGDLASADTRLLTAAFCTGLLETVTEGTVNTVNAEYLMKERGIEVVTESHSEGRAFSSSMRASIESAGETISAGGTLFGNDMPRLIALNQYQLEAYLDGIMLIFTHQDVPGIIGSVGTIFGDHQVNIAQMSVGRAGAEPGGEAVGVLNLDSRPSAEAVAAVLDHSHIHQLRIIELPAAGELPSWLT
ncbi:MAG: phosphoglycerate dehydrogenase [Planctomycetota bacterium]